MWAMIGGGGLIALVITVLAVGPGDRALYAQPGPQTPTPLPLYALPDASRRVYASGSIALQNVQGPNARMVAANMLNNTATILVPEIGTVVAEIAVGLDPRGVAFTPDDRRALVVNRGDSTLAIIDTFSDTPMLTHLIPLDGVWPYSVVAGDDGFAYVALNGSDSIAVVDLQTDPAQPRVVGAIPVPDAPAGLTLWGEFLYVTHFWSGEVTLIYTPQRRIVETIRTGLDTALFQALAIDRTRGLAYLPQTRLNAQTTVLTHDTAALPVVNVLDLRSLAISPEQRLALDIADRPVNMPFAAAVNRFAQPPRLYIANAGSDTVAEINLGTGAVEAQVPVGANPRGVRLNSDNSRLYVHNTLDGTISTVDTNTEEVIDVLPISNLTISVDVLLGAQLFHGAADPRLSTGSWLSCASCHFDGQSDGRVWRGFPDGPRNTPLLYGLPETVPYNWSATWDELSDVEVKIRDLQAGTGLIETLRAVTPMGEPHDGLSPDLDLLTMYLNTLQAPGSAPPVAAARVARGEAVFMAEACTDCHIPPAFTNLQSYDVGTGVSPLERRDTAFDTPSLRWLWLSAPYFHDGSAATLREVFELPGEHQLVTRVAPADIDALVGYLLSLPNLE
ncbi:MAG: hypothetical protein GYB67_17980 [Chloroflexi bacterium]|nr:hypothetical protein [Chloroflexota bacterium]